MFAHKLIAASTLLLGAVMAWGASGISSEAGYAGIGPNFMPLAVAVALMACGAFLLREAFTGGFRHMPQEQAGAEAAPGAAPGADWQALAWVAAGLVANAALIQRIGFILSCTLCFVLAVRGLRHAEGKQHGGAVGVVRDLSTGALVAAPAFWLFTKLLGINLPGLTGTGWI